MTDPRLPSLPPLFSNHIHIAVTDGQTVVLTFTYQPPEKESQPQIESSKSIPICQICLTRNYFESMLDFYSKMQNETTTTSSLN